MIEQTQQDYRELSIKDSFMRLSTTKYCNGSVLASKIDLVSADSTFNAWIAITVKSKHPERLFDLSLFCDNYHTDVRAVIDALIQNGDPERCALELEEIRQRIFDSMLEAPVISAQ